jgi:hypothetical protein
VLDDAARQTHRLGVAAVGRDQGEGMAQQGRIFRVVVQRPEHEIRRRGKVALLAGDQSGKVIAVGRAAHQPEIALPLGRGELQRPGIGRTAADRRGLQEAGSENQWQAEECGQKPGSQCAAGRPGP